MSIRIDRLVGLMIALTVLAVCITPTRAVAQPYTICLDPGHGGSDPGAVGCGMEEAAVNLQVGLMLRDLMEADPDLVPIMTRSTDVFISLQGRCDYANDNGATRFASVHCNAFNGAASGIETYCYTSGSSTSFDQRDRIQAHMIATWPALPDRGGKTANFTVLTNTAMPATLSELAFIDNCSADATYLSDPVELQAAATAHHLAIRESLGLGGDPPVGNGTLQGTVFEDQGVGTEDMTVRLPGAQVQVSGPGVQDSATADSPDAMWLFSVPAGGYTITASHPGHITNSRNCDVVSGVTTWCSVGLFPEPPPPPDPEPDLQPQPDLQPPPDGGVDLPPPDLPPPVDLTTDTTPPGPDTTVIDTSPPVPDTVPVDSTPPTPDTSVADVPSGPDHTGGSDLPPWFLPDGSGLPDVSEAPSTGGSSDGCSSTGSAAVPGLLVVCGMLGFMAFRKRRTICAGLVLAIVGLMPGGCEPPLRHHANPRPLLSTASSNTPSGPVDVAVQATQMPDGLALTDIRRITPESDFQQPVWSPDGSRIALAGPRFASLHVVVAQGGPVRQLVEAPGAGYAPVWFPSSDAIGYRRPGQRMSETPVLSVAVGDTAAGPPAHPHPGRWVRVRDDAVFFRSGDNQRRVSPPGDQYCCAQLSADGHRMVWEGLASGVYVHDATVGVTHVLGPGTHPRFSSDSSRVVFDRCEDDGRALVQCSLHLAIVEPARAVVRRLVNTPSLARYPSLSPDGRTIAFEVDGAIYTGRL